MVDFLGLSKRSGLALAVTFLVNTSGHAQDFSYSYIQWTYASVDTEVLNTDIDGDGFVLSGSAGITDNVAFTFGYEDIGYDFDFDSEALRFGADLHTPIAPDTDAVIGFSVLDAEVSHPSLGSEDDSGNIIAASARHRLSQNAEIEAGVSRTDVFDDTSTSVGVALLFGREVQFGGGLSTSDDSDSFQFGVRANF